MYCRLATAVVVYFVIVATIATAQEPSMSRQLQSPPVTPAPPPANRVAFRSAPLPQHLMPTSGTLVVTGLPSAMLPTEAACLDPIAVGSEMSLPLLIDQVLVSHPSLTAAIATWRAAAAKYPQAVSLDDPMLDFMMAPGTIGNRDLDFAYIVQGRQKIPWHGKRPLRGAVVQSEAQALAYDANDVRRRLIEVTQLAFFDYAVVASLEQLNKSNRQALVSFRANAVTRYESDLVSQQDVLLADVELAKLERRAIELIRQRRVAEARINTLLLRRPDSQLPPPPQLQDSREVLLPIEVLHAMAQQQRPDLAARQSRIRAAQASLGLAQREYAPDLEFSGQYNTMWQGMDSPMQGQVGLSLNIPLAHARREGAVREAMATISQDRAEWQNLSFDIQREVQEAYERLRESEGILALYRERILPAAEQSVESAVAGYVSGSLDFLRLIEAERQLIQLREEQVMARLEYYERRAEVERVIAGPLPQSSPEEIPPGVPQAQETPRRL